MNLIRNDGEIYKPNIMTRQTVLSDPYGMCFSVQLTAPERIGESQAIEQLFKWSQMIINAEKGKSEEEIEIPAASLGFCWDKEKTIFSLTSLISQNAQNPMTLLGFAFLVQNWSAHMLENFKAINSAKAEGDSDEASP